MIVAMLLLHFANTSFVAAAGPHTPVEEWHGPRLYHAPFDNKFSQNIHISKTAWPSMLMQHHYSTNQIYWYGVIVPDTTKHGPWNTSVFIDNERRQPVQIQLLNHNHYPVQVRWINEKLLFIRVWWGRIVGTDLLYDVEREELLAREMIKDGKHLFHQYQDSRSLLPVK